MERLGLVVHPVREIDGALATLRTWADEHEVDVVQVPTPGMERQVAPLGQTSTCDLVIALGGDGTTLAALRHLTPVLGVACGSLGALTATAADHLEAALDRVFAGDWTPRTLPALEVAGSATRHAINDLVLVRMGAGQVSVSVSVDDELYVRFGGDGIVIATPLGSSAYTLAAGGPVLAPGSRGLVVTPLAAHGGCCPPLVTGPDSVVRVQLDPGHGGARIEVDGRIEAQADPHSAQDFEARLRPGLATLVSFGDEEPFLAGLRRRRILIDSPRILARDDRNSVQRV